MLAFLFVTASNSSAQDTLKIRKTTPFYGAYYHKTESGLYNYIVFDGIQQAYVFTSARKPKKVFRKDRYMGMAVRSTAYKTETKRVHFQFTAKRGDKIHWEEYECENLPDLSEIDFKISVSDQPVKVVRYKKYSGYKLLVAK
jgi:hypothetical protein